MKWIDAHRFVKTVKEQVFPTFQEFIYIAILTGFFTFLSFMGHTRAEPGATAGFVVVYFGFPLEWFKISANLGSWYSTMTRTEILWVGLAADVIMFVSISLVLVRLADKIADYFHIPSDFFKL